MLFLVSLCRYFTEPELLQEAQKIQVGSLLPDSTDIPVQTGALKYVLHTKVGPGPQILGEEHSLIDPRSGLPKYCRRD